MKKIVIANAKGGVGKSTLALALADVLGNAQIIDLDNQGSITQSAVFTKRHTPISLDKITSNYIIYDTPPYMSEELPSIIKNSDLVIIPTRIGDYDLLALGGIIDMVRKAKVAKKSIIVFNAVPTRVTKSIKTSRDYFLKNYKDIKKANTELGNYEGFRKIAIQPIFGAAKKQMLNLLNEFKVIL